MLFEWESQTLSIRTGILRHYVPASARSLGAAWWRGQATAFLMQPLPWLEEELQSSMRRCHTAPRHLLTSSATALHVIELRCQLQWRAP